MKNLKTFVFPSTPTCRVIYTRQGVQYGGTIQTPTTQQELMSAMSARQASVNDIIRIEPIEPRGDQMSCHPAQFKIQRLAAESER